MTQHVFVMQGVSGSGKSTHVQKLVEQYQAKVVSADYFFMQNGEYRFNPALLGQAHAQCYDLFLQHLFNGNNVVVDNTNTSAIEIAPYASAVGAINHRNNNTYCNFKILWVKRALEECIKYNTHGVSQGIVYAQADRIDRFHSGGNIYRWDVEVINNQVK